MIIHFILYIFGFAQQSPDEEQQWMEEIQAGNKKSLGKLYGRYNQILFGMIYNVLRNREETEDLLQEVFVQIWEKASQFDRDRGTVYSFIVTLSRNKAIDRTRSKAFKNSKKDDHVINDDDFHLDLEHDSPNPEQNLVLDERARSVKKALEQLDKKERQVLYISYYQGLSQSEIAKKINIPLGTVKYRMRQGMLKLRGMLAEV